MRWTILNVLTSLFVAILILSATGCGGGETEEVAAPAESAAPAAASEAAGDASGEMEGEEAAAEEAAEGEGGEAAEGEAAEGEAAEGEAAEGEAAEEIDCDLHPEDPECQGEGGGDL